MQYKTFTLADFGGGLNTSSDESLLPPNMSPNMVNADVLESRAIKRRRGYQNYSDAISSGRIRGLHRYYRTDGSNFWMAVCATGVYLRQDSVNDVPATTLEAESATVTGSSSTVTPSYTSSGGQVRRVSTTASFSIPYSTSVKVNGAFGAVGASLAIDSGSYITATGSSYTFSSLTATAHTVRVKSSVRNLYCIRQRPVGDRATSTLSRSISALTEPAIGQTSSAHVSLMFYDPSGTDGAGIDALVRVTGGTGLEVNGSIGLYQHPTLGSTTRYHASGVGAFRIRGRNAWHTVEMTVRYTRTGAGGYLEIINPRLDGSSAGLPATLAAGTIDDFLSIGIGTYTRRYGTSSVPIWFDTYRENGGLVDDHVSVSGWVEGGTSTTYPVAIDSLQKDSERRTDIDSFVYSALGNFTSIATISASAETIGLTTLNNRAYFGTAYNNIRYTTGASAVTVSASGTVKPGYLVENKRRLFSSGQDGDTSLLNYTAVDAPDDWTGGGSIRLAGKDSGGECTGLAVWDNLLFYFAPSRIYALDATGTDDQWVSKTLHSRYGCVAPNSLAVAANGVVFLADDAVRAYGYIPNVSSDDGSGIINLSENIRPTLAAISNKGIAAGAVFRDRYWLSCALDGASENTHILVCDLEKRSENGQPVWTLYDIPGITVFEVTRGDEYGLYAGTSDGRIIQLDIGDTDNGESIKMVYDTPPLPVGGYQTTKHFRHLHILGQSDTTQEVTITPSTDDVNGQPLTVALSPSTAVQPVRKALAARGRYVKLAIETDGANSPVTVSSLTLTYRPDARLR